jgi:hypothetical protein
VVGGGSDGHHPGRGELKLDMELARHIHNDATQFHAWTTYRLTRRLRLSVLFWRLG